MHGIGSKTLPVAARYLSIGFLAASTFAFAQDTGPASQPNPSGWKRVGSAQVYTPNQSASANQYPQYPQNQSGDPNQPPPPPQQPNYNQPPNYSQQNNQAPPPPPVPASLTIPQGTYVTARVNEMLSSDKNQPGDAFTATLEQPIVVNGVVVAEPGQTLGGRVVSADKHSVGTPGRLGIQLTNMTLVDGQQVSINTQFISRRGGSTPGGEQVGTVAATTGIGAAIGAAADWGTGAAIGAGAGAAAGLIGVLVTRNHASVIYPEQALTFRLEAPVTISTENGQQAFRYIQPNEYDRPQDNGPAPGPAYGTAAPPPPYYGYGAYYGYPYAYPYYGYGYPYWGPSFAFYYSPGFWWGGHWYGHGYYGHGYYGHGYYGHGGNGHGYAGGHSFQSHGAVAGGHGGGGFAGHGGGHR
jgi:hypothetical protein